MRRILLVTSALALSVALAAPLRASTAPAVGTEARPTDVSASFSDATSGGRAIPLEAATPEWYTADIARRVDQANGEPVAAPNDAPLPSEIGIRPGAWMIAPAGCTMNFVFARQGSWAIGTAGHCVDEVGQEVVLLTLAPGTENPVLVEVGSVLSFRDEGIGDDFALVSIRPELNEWVSPTAALIAGPCGAYSGSGPETVAHVGHGLVIGTGGTPRAGLALTWREDAYGWDGAGIFGDSGSPVRVTALQAAGNLTHLVVGSSWLPSFIVGTRIGRMQEIAGAGWSLASSPLCL